MTNNTVETKLNFLKDLDRHDLACDSNYPILDLFLSLENKLTKTTEREYKTILAKTEHYLSSLLYDASQDEDSPGNELVANLSQAKLKFSKDIFAMMLNRLPDAYEPNICQMTYSAINNLENHSINNIKSHFLNYLKSFARFMKKFNLRGIRVIKLIVRHREQAFGAREFNMTNHEEFLAAKVQFLKEVLPFACLLRDFLGAKEIGQDTLIDIEEDTSVINGVVLHHNSSKEFGYVDKMRKIISLFPNRESIDVIHLTEIFCVVRYDIVWDDVAKVDQELFQILVDPPHVK